MKRTINEVYEIIKQKRENALNDYKSKKDPYKKIELKGEFDAYTDILTLIETSQILKKED